MLFAIIVAYYWLFVKNMVYEGWHLGAKSQGIKLHYGDLKPYLWYRLGVEKVFLFIGAPDVPSGTSFIVDQKARP